jgi:hypothetical protein
MKKTAVDYLYEKLWGIHKDKFTWQMILNEAKKKEKRQVINDYHAGHDNGSIEQDITGEQYYKETYTEK